MKRIIYISVHPIHYNDFLFDEIRKSGIDIEVYYSNKILRSYPWKEKMSYSFPTRDCSYFLKIDWGLVRRAFLESDTLFIVAGWESFFKNIFLFLLILFGRKYIVLTDTVNIEKPRSAIKGRLRNAWLNLILGRAFRIFTTGSIGVTQFKRFFRGDAERVLNFPFATDLNYFNTVPDFTGYENCPRLFSSGRLLNYHKGHDLAIRVLGRLKKEGYHFSYKIAGTGPDEKMLLALIAENDLKNEVTLLGWQELAGVKENYAAAHVLLHPSHFDPFPNAILESMASGLVVVASDKAGSAVERVVPNVSGFIFPDDNEEALIAVLRSVLGKTAPEMKQISDAAKAVAAKWSVKYNTDIVHELMR